MGLNLTVGSGAYASSDGMAIQKAIDDASANGGGTVTISSGTYRLRNAVQLKSNIRLVGEDKVILVREPSINTELAQYVGYGHYEVPLINADGFEVGDGIHIEDDNSVGFYNTQATIIAKKNNTVFIDRMLSHDYHPSKSPNVTRVFSVIEACNITDAAVENLTLDGNINEKYEINGCRAGGIYFLGCSRMSVIKVEIENFKGDALSFQQCVDVNIRGCDIHNNSGSGLHPGSGSVRYVMQDNNVHENGGCGLFYCLRTTHSICANNRFENNHRQGISIGERDTDHIIRSNKILSNHKQGIIFRELLRTGGDRVLIDSNIIGSNCKTEGEYEIEVTPGISDVHIYNNKLVPVKAKPVRIWDSGPDVYFCDNTISGKPQAREHIHGSHSRTKTVRTQLPPLGPETLPLDGAMHLGIPHLWEWKSMDT